MSIHTLESDLQEAIELVERLTEALRIRTSTSCATGILMERYGVSLQDARSMLIRLSNDAHTKTPKAAELIVAGQPLEALRAPRPRSANDQANDLGTVDGLLGR